MQSLLKFVTEKKAGGCRRDDGRSEMLLDKERKLKALRDLYIGVPRPRAVNDEVLALVQSSHR